MMLWIRLRLDSVASALNISDQVSRGNFDHMHELSAHKVHLELTLLWTVLIRIALSDEYACGSAVDDLLLLPLSSISLCSSCTGGAEEVPVRMKSGSAVKVCSHLDPTSGILHARATGRQREKITSAAAPQTK